MSVFQFLLSDVEEDNSKGFELPNGQSLFAVRKDGQLFVYFNNCPHLDVALEWQEDQFLDSDKALIQCCNHGALFIIENGECVAGPCLGDSLQALPFRIENNQVSVDISSLD